MPVRLAVATLACALAVVAATSGAATQARRMAPGR